MSKKKFVIIDGNAILHRAYHALPPFTTKGGTLVNAVYGFTTTLLKIFKELKPEYIAVTFDTKAPTFRHQEYKEYKAQREKKPQELYNQIDYIKQVLSAMNIHFYEKDGYEADDIIATLTKLASGSQDIESVIVTGDMDALQLVAPAVSVYTFKKGLSEAQTYDEAAVGKRYGLPPSALIDFKALRGDPSDNIPGVKGIGEKNGAELIKNFGSIEKLYEALKKDTPAVKKISPRIKALLLEHEDDAILGKRLVTLIKDVPIKFSLQDVRRKSADREVLVELLRSLGFHSLLPRLEEMSGGDVKKELPKSQKVTFEILKSVNQVKVFLKKTKNMVIRSSRSGVEGSVPEHIALIGEEAGGVILKPNLEILELLREWLLEPGKVAIGHNLKNEFHTLGITVRGAKLFDVMIASYLIDPGSRAHELASEAFSILGIEPSGVGKQQSLLAGPEERIKDVFDEALAIWKLKTHYESELEEKNLKKLFEEIEMPLLPILFAMEKVGVLIDREFLGKMSKDFAKRIAKLQRQIYELADSEFNINSPSQLGKIIFEKLKISSKEVKKTAGGSALSTAAGELEKLRGHHPIIDLIFEYRELTKLKSTYIDALPELADKIGRIHTTFNQTVTSTGRLSSSNPNLQNIPVKTELGREIRKAFVAQKGFSLIAADYSQFELRIAAHLSGDKAMIEDFKSGEDIHTRTAEIIWSVEHTGVTKEMRRIAKAINFGIIYGMGPKKLATEAGVSMEEARDFIDRFFAGRPRLGEFITEMKTLATAEGYAQTLFGRRRYLPEITSGVPMLRAEAERQAVNTPIQGTQADVIKIAMINLSKILPQKFGRDLTMLLQVHDELVFEVRDERTDEAASLIQEIMESAVKLKVPTVVEVEIGKNWGEMRQWKG